MPAYVIVETDVTDPAQYEQYKAASPAAVAARLGHRGRCSAAEERGRWAPDARP